MLASNSPVKLQAGVLKKLVLVLEKVACSLMHNKCRTFYIQHTYGPVEQRNLVAETQSNRLLRPYFSFSSGLLNHHYLVFAVYKTSSNIIAFLHLAGPTLATSVFQEAK